MYYGERPPAESLRPFASACWHFRVDDAAGTLPHVIPPDASVSIAVVRAHPEPMVVGPFTEPFHVTVHGGDCLWGVRLLPAVAPVLVRVPMAALRNTRVPLAQVGSATLADAIRTRMAVVATEQDAVVAWADVLAPALAASAAPDTLILAVAVAMARAQGDVALGELAVAAGLSPRQLRRRFVRSVGLSPKEFVRLRRVRATLASAVQARDRQWNEIAASHGFADQAHLVREIRRLAGLTPTVLLTQLMRIVHGDIVDP